MNIRIGIVGYGNLARGVEASVKLQPDMELFTKGLLFQNYPPMI